VGGGARISEIQVDGRQDDHVVMQKHNNNNNNNKVFCPNNYGTVLWNTTYKGRTFLVPRASRGGEDNDRGFPGMVFLSR